jgi:hypothetical protein
MLITPGPDTSLEGKTLIVDDFDASLLSYRGEWLRRGAYSDNGTSFNGTVTGARETNASISFAFTGQ